MASTYVNNLRLEEMATGEQSGTWGTKTNTNLELIGQVAAWGTRAIANASTDNITIADGAADADRCLGLKLTGGGQACTVTLLPNTSSKTWVMYNATSYTLTFTCGSGANVAILAGETKIIATDGLGSGGVVYDLLTAVNLAGTTKTAVLTNAGALTQGGASQFNSTLTVGVDGTGYDVKFFGDTASRYVLWDQSADSLLFSDNAKLILGQPGNDLQVYHDASNSYIKDSGTGHLYISGSQVNLRGSNDAIMVNGIEDGAVNIYYNANLKLATVTGGVNITGELEADSLDIDGVAQIDGTLTVGVDNTGYDVTFFGATTGKSLLWDESADQLIVTGTTSLVGTANLDAVDIDGNTQMDGTLTVGVNDQGYDVKFFGDTASAYMLWDTSADDLILGGAARMQFGAAGSNGKLVMSKGSGTVTDYISLVADSLETRYIAESATIGQGILGTFSAHAQAFYTNSSQKMSITSAGLVGIGVVGSGGQLLNIGGAGNSYMSIYDTNQGSSGGSDGLSIGMTGVNANIILREAGIMTLYTSNTGRMTIGATGQFNLVPTSAGAAQGVQVNSEGMANGSNGVFLYVGSATGNFISGNNASGQQFAITHLGALSKTSGSFKIAHPLPSKNATHSLVHSFIEGPQADLIYRGTADLVSGVAIVNIDTAAGMTDGTFVALCTDVQCFTSNEDGWTALKGSVTGNILTITAQDNTCTDTVGWMVIGERCDPHMLETDWTDAAGKVIVEPLKPEPIEPLEPLELQGGE